MQQVTISDVGEMLLDIMLLTFLQFMELSLVFGKSVFDHHHGVVPVSDVFIGGICPSLWLRLKYELIGAKLVVFQVILWRDLNSKIEIIAARPHMLSVLHSRYRVSSQMPWDTTESGILLISIGREETVT